jgi:hypothetical protein
MLVINIVWNYLIKENETLWYCNMVLLKENVNLFAYLDEN